MRATVRALGGAEVDAQAWRASAHDAALRTIVQSDLDAWARASRKWGSLGDVDGCDAARDRMVDGYLTALVNAAARTGERDARRAVAQVTREEADRVRIVRAAARSGPGTTDHGGRVRSLAYDPSVLEATVDGGDRAEGWDPDAV